MVAKQRTEAPIPIPVPAKGKSAFLEIIDQAEETNIEKIRLMVLRALILVLICCVVLFPQSMTNPTAHCRGLAVALPRCDQSSIWPLDL